jgi:predicted nuclease of predicted toxin-antitoxin system
VKLLFDHNLSHRLLHALQSEYPDSQHVRNIGLAEASDEAIWRHAIQQGFTIITKDADFHQRSFLFGHPPKVAGSAAGIARPRPLSNFYACAATISFSLLPTEKGHFSSSSSNAVSPLAIRGT